MLAKKDAGRRLSDSDTSAIKNISKIISPAIKTQFKFRQFSSFAFTLICLLFLVSIVLSLRNDIYAADLVAEAGPNQSVEVNQPVSFDGSASSGPAVTYLWDFGDGSTAGAINPSHVYTSAGTYTVTLTVDDGLGGNSNDTLTVTVANMGPPSPPSNLTGYGGDNTVVMRWDENSESDLAGYNLYRSQVQGGPYTKINTVLLSVSSFNDDTVSNGTTYYYVVTAEDISSYESAYSAEASVVPSSTGPTTVGGTLTGNNTWFLSSSPYQVTSNLTVAAGASLTIEPGVVIEFDSGMTMDIQGSLNVMGTASNRVLFTSSAAVPQKGDWGGINYTHNSGSSFSMDYAIVEYGSFGINYSASSGTLSPSITNSIIRQTGGHGISFTVSGTVSLTVTLENNEVHNNDGRGIYCYANGASAYLDSTIRNSQIYNNGNYGVYLYTSNADYTTVIEGNSIHGNGSYGLYSYHPYYSDGSLTISDNTIYGNVTYGIFWYISGGTHSGVIDKNEVYNSGTGISVLQSAATVSDFVIAGNIVHDGTYGIRWSSNTTAVIPVIVYNEIYNNSSYGIYITNLASTGVINYNNIYNNTAYGIYNSSINAVDARLNWWGAAVTAEMNSGGNPKNITAIYDIYDSRSRGMVNYSGWLSGPAGISSDRVSYITVPLDGDAVKPGVYTIKGVAYATAGIDSVEVSVDGGNTWLPAAGTGSWSYDWTIPGDGVYNIRSRVTDENLVVESPGAGVNLTVNSSLQTTSGTLGGDETWTGIVNLTGDITVPAGVTLTLDPGTVIRFPALYDETMSGSDTSRTELIVNGSLVVAGTSGSPVTFTSNAAVPQKDDWGGIDYNYSAGSTFTMDYAIVEYGSFGIDYSAGTGTLSPSITNSKIRYTGGDGIYINVTGTASLTITLENNEINDNDGRGISCYALGASVFLDSTVGNSQVYSNGGYGIYLDINSSNYSTLIEGNIIHSNGSYGLYSYGYYPFLSTSGGSFTVRDNTIYGNALYGIHWNVTFGTHSSIIENNTVNNSGTGIYMSFYNALNSDVGIVRNDVYGGTDGIKLNGRFSDLVTEVLYNDIYNNSNSGINITNLGASAAINYNNIYGNTNYGIYNNSTYAIDGRLNWWGAATTAEMDSGINPKNITAIYDIYDNGLKGMVDYAGWLNGAMGAVGDRVSHITAPLDGDAVKPGVYTIKGVAYATAGIDSVEVSVDGGNTWLPAAGTGSWSYDWTIPGDGVYNIRSRVTDRDLVVESPGAGVTLTVDSTLPITSGTLGGDETWSGIVNLTGDITVPAGVTLTLDPGTVLRFPATFDDTAGGSDPSRSELIVNGSLVVSGTSGSPVVFTSDAISPQKNDWGGIDYTYSPGSSFSINYAVIEYSSFGIAYSTDADTLSPSITNSIIRQTGGDGISVTATGTAALFLTLEDNEIYDNDGRGIYCYGSGVSASLDTTARNNQVYSNGNYGIYLNMSSADFTTLIEGSSIHDNSSYGLYSKSSNAGGSFTARNNAINNNSTYGIYLQTSYGTPSGTIAGNTISYSGTGVYVSSAMATFSDLQIVKNNIHDGTYGIRVDGLYAITPVVLYNDIYNNTNNGIHIYASDISGAVNYNNIYGNTGFALYNNSLREIDGRFNWWGTAVTNEMDSTSYPSDISAIYDIFDDISRGAVAYDQWVSNQLVLDKDPVSNITDPLDGEAIKPGIYTVSGVAAAVNDIEMVEISLDGGMTWQAAYGTYVWSYEWDASTDGVYSIRSRVTDRDGLTETAGPGITVTVDSGLTSITTSGTMTADETWSGTVTLTGDVIVPAGVTLTIDPGTLIQFTARYDDTGSGQETSRTELYVEGSLVALGTQASPITFTSSSPSPQKNDWGGIRFKYIYGGKFEMDWAVVEYGTHGVAYEVSSASLDFSMMNSIIRHTGGDAVSFNVTAVLWATYTHYSLILDKNRFYDNDGAGIYSYAFYLSPDADQISIDYVFTENEIYGNGGRGIDVTLQSTIIFAFTIEDNIIHDNGDDGIRITSFGSYNSTATVKGNSIYNNTDYGIYWYAPSDTTIDDNTIYNNGTGIYVFANNAYGHSLKIINNEIHSGTVGIEANTPDDPDIYHMMNNKIYDNSSNGINLSGQVSTLFMGYNDVYNNGGYGIYTNSTATLKMNYNNIYGNTGFAVYNNNSGAVDGRFNWWGAAVTAEMNAGGNPKDITGIYDLYDNSAKGVVNYSRWLQAIQTLTDGSVSHITYPMDGTTVRQDTLTIQGTASAGAGIEKVEVSTDGGSNWFEAEGTHSWSYEWTIPGDGVYTIISRATDLNSTVETPGAGVVLTVDSGSVTTSGALDGDETWSGVVNLTGDVTVPAGVTLTISPDTVITFPALFDDTGGGSYLSRTELIVKGSLIVSGAPGMPVTFTSDSPSPQKNDWGGIDFTHNTGEVFSIDYAVIEYGSYGIKYYALNGRYYGSITNSIIRHTGSDGIYFSNSSNGYVIFDITGNIIDDNDRYGIYTPGSNLFYISVTFNSISNNDEGLRLSLLYDLVVANNNIFNNSSYGLNLISSGSIDAGLNWWNDPSGPSGAGPGSGDNVDSYVKYDPWLEQNSTPAFYFVDAAATATKFSPNGSTTVFKAELTEEADWTIEIINASSQAVRTINGTGDTINYAWDGTDDGMSPLSDGVYTYKMSALRTSDQLPAAAVVGIIELETVLPVADISSPQHLEVRAGGDIITVTGTADSPNFSSYSLKYGIGENPSAWNYPIGSGTSPVIDDVLGTWNVPITSMEFYSFQLTVMDTFGNTAETRATVRMLSRRSFTDGPDPFSPDGDSVNDTTTISALLTMPVDWTINIKDSGSTVVKTYTGSGSLINQVWDGTDSGLSTVPDGTYTYEITSAPVSGSVLYPITDTVRVDTTPPTAIFTSLTNGQIITGDVDYDITGTASDDYSSSYYKVEYGAGASPTNWILIDDGMYVFSGSLAVWETSGIPNGDYTVRLTVIDKSGVETVTSVLVTIDSIKISNVSVSATTIKPLESETSGITYDLDRDADVTVKIYDKDLVLVRTIINAVPQLQGTNVVYWDGKDDSSAIVPYEAYTYTIEASNAAGRSGVYDPEYVSGIVMVHGNVVPPEFKPYEGETAEITYDLVAPSRVTIGIGYGNGMYVGEERVLIDAEPRDVNDNKELWDGTDNNGVLVASRDYNVYGWTEILPENVIITKNSTLMITTLSAEAYQIMPSYSAVSTIYYTISANARVTVKIYDPDGNPCRTLLDDVQKTAGVNTIEWDGRDNGGSIVSTQGAYSVKVLVTDTVGNFSTERRGTIFVY